MSTILCVDDDAYLGDLLSYALKREGHTLHVAHTGAEALKATKLTSPDLVLLDVKLPDADGLALCAYFRTILHIPVIMVTGCTTDEDMIGGFAKGADDYIRKPFNMQVLAYRVRAVLRRAHADPTLDETASQTYTLGSVNFTPSRNEMLSGSTVVKLTKTESKILHLLVMNAGHVVPPERILERVWGYNAESAVAVVKTHIHNLRAKVAPVTGAATLIETVDGAGYMCPRESIGVNVA
jgi:DNA-binding response OmpR family regulator